MTNAVENSVFASTNGNAGFTNLVKESGNSGPVETHPVQTVDGRPINWNRKKLSNDLREYTMLVGMPVRKARQPIDDFFRISVKQVRPVGMNEHPLDIKHVIR